MPASKRQKVSKGGDAPAQANGLAFLVDENDRSSRQLKAELSNGLATSRSPATKPSRTNIAADAADDDLERETSSGKQARHSSSKSAIKNAATSAVGVASDVIDISSGEDSDELDEEEEAQVDAVVNAQLSSASTPHGLKTYDSVLTNGKSTNRGAEDGSYHTDDDAEEEPAFGELLLARHEGAINVRQSLAKTMVKAWPHCQVTRLWLDSHLRLLAQS